MAKHRTPIVVLSRVIELKAMRCRAGRSLPETACWPADNLKLADLEGDGTWDGQINAPRPPCHR